MKKRVTMTLLAVGLAGCVQPEPLPVLDYSCFTLIQVSDRDISKGIRAGDAFCVSYSDLMKMDARGYTDDQRHSFYGMMLDKNRTSMAANIGFKGAACRVSTHKPNECEYGNPYPTGVFAYSDGPIIPKNLKIHVVPDGAFDKLLREQAEEQREQDAIKADETKYGAKICSATRTTDCLIKLQYGRYRFLQHIDDGTLISFVRWERHNPLTWNYNGYWGARTYLIVGDSDARLGNGQYVPGGVFKVVGTYTYKSITGITETVSKIRRMSRE